MDLEFDDMRLLRKWEVLPESSFSSLMQALRRDSQLVALDTDGMVGYRAVARALGSLMQNRLLRFLTFVYARNYAIPVTSRHDPTEKQCTNNDPAEVFRRNNKHVVKLLQSDPARFSLPLAFAVLVGSDSIERLSCPPIDPNADNVLHQWKFRRDPTLFSSAVKEMLRFFECNSRSLMAPGIEKALQCIEQQFMGRSQAMDAPSRPDTFKLAGMKLDILRAMAHLRPEPLPEHMICTDPLDCCAFDDNPQCCTSAANGESLAAGCSVDFVPCICELGRGKLMPGEYQWTLPLAEQQVRLMVFIQERLNQMATQIAEYATEMSIRTQRVAPCLGVLGDPDFLEGNENGVDPQDADPVVVRNWTTTDNDGQLVLKDDTNDFFRIPLPRPDDIWCRYYLWKTSFTLTAVLRYRGLRNNRFHKIVDLGELAGDVVLGGGIDSFGTRIGVRQEKRWPNYENYDVESLGSLYYALGTQEPIDDVNTGAEVLQRQGIRKGRIELPLGLESVDFASASIRDQLLDDDEFFIRQFDQGPVRQCFPISAGFQRREDDPTKSPPSLVHRPNCTACYVRCVADVEADCGMHAFTPQTRRLQGEAEFEVLCTGVAQNAWGTHKMRADNDPVCQRSSQRHACGPRQPCPPGQACDFLRGRCVPAASDDQGGKRGYMPLGATVSKRIMVSEALTESEIVHLINDLSSTAKAESQAELLLGSNVFFATLETVQLVRMPVGDLRNEMDGQTYVWEKSRDESTSEHQDEDHARWDRLASIMRDKPVQIPTITLATDHWFGWDTKDFPGTESDVHAESMFSVDRRDGEVPNCPDPALTLPNGTNPEGYTQTIGQMRCRFTTLEMRLQNPTLVYKLARLRDYLNEDLSDYEIETPTPIPSSDLSDPLLPPAPQGEVHVSIPTSLQYAPLECLSVSRQTARSQVMPPLWDLSGDPREIETVHALRSYVARMYGWLNVSAVPTSERELLGLGGHDLQPGGANEAFQQCLQENKPTIVVPRTESLRKEEQWKIWHDHRCVAMTPYIVNTTSAPPLQFDWPTQDGGDAPVWDQLRFLVFDETTIRQMVINGWSALPRRYIEDTDQTFSSPHDFADSAHAECVKDGSGPLSYNDGDNCCRTNVNGEQCGEFSPWRFGAGRRLNRHIHTTATKCFALNHPSPSSVTDCYDNWPYPFQCDADGDHYPKSGPSPIPWPDWWTETDPDCLHYLPYRGDGGALHKQTTWTSRFPRPLFPFMFEHDVKHHCKRLEKIPFEERVFIEKKCLISGCWEHLVAEEWDLPRHIVYAPVFENRTGYTPAELDNMGLTPPDFPEVTMETDMPDRLLRAAIEVNASNLEPYCELETQRVLRLPTGEPIACREDGTPILEEVPMRCLTDSFELVQDDAGNYFCERECDTIVENNETACAEGTSSACSIVTENGTDARRCVRRDGVVLPPEGYWTCEEGPDYTLIWRFSDIPEGCVRDSPVEFRLKENKTEPWEMQIHCHYVNCTVIPMPGQHGQDCTLLDPSWSPSDTALLEGGSAEAGTAFKIFRPSPWEDVGHPGKCVLEVTKPVLLSNESEYRVDEADALAHLDQYEREVLEGLTVYELTRVQADVSQCIRVDCVDKTRRKVREAFLFQGESSVRNFVEFDRKTAQCKNNAFVDAVELDGEDEFPAWMDDFRCSERASLPAFCYNLDQAPSFEKTECQYNEIMERSAQNDFFPFNEC